MVGGSSRLRSHTFEKVNVVASSTGEQLVAASREFGPRIEAVADQIEQDRALPADLVEAFIDAEPYSQTVYD